MRLSGEPPQCGLNTELSTAATQQPHSSTTYAVDKDRLGLNTELNTTPGRQGCITPTAAATLYLPGNISTSIAAHQILIT